MREHIVRTQAPAATITIEVEGPVRVVCLADSEEERAALFSWLLASGRRDAIVRAAFAERRKSGGAARGRAWARLLRERGGVETVERLLGQRQPTR